MKNKRGQGLSTNAIILIILGVLVLVMLIVGFTAGWDKIAPWIKPSNNVKEIVDACGIACSTNSVYDFCSVERTLIVEGQNNIVSNCSALSTNPDYTQYGVQPCGSICS